MTNDQVHESLVAWIATVTGQTTIKAYQSGPRPVGVYLMVNLTGTVNVRDNPELIDYSPDRDDEPAPTEDTAGDPIYPDITATPVVETEWRFSVFAYGGDQPSDRLRPIVSAQHLTQVVEPMYPDLHVHEVSQIRSVPEWVNAEWEQRAQVDVFLRGLTRDGFVISTIDDIEPFNVSRIGT